MRLPDQIFSALAQVGLVAAFALLVFLVIRFACRNPLKNISFFEFIGFVGAGDQLDTKFMLMFFGMILFAVSSATLEFQFSEDFRNLLAGKNSPYGNVLRDGMNITTFSEGALYCFLQSAAAEEILFRGLVAKRLFKVLGVFRGNVAQATVFWVMHFALFRLITGRWFSEIQISTFIISFGLGLVLGYANVRKHGESILPSWILHGFANFTTFLTLGYLMN